MRNFFILLFIALPLFATTFTNALIHEESPYLRQHAHNPVNWYAWNQKSFNQAKKQNKLIFVSIGYSTCHWCHVMEKESFENKHIAKLLNQDYINIKVDKEEMPHLDTAFQEIHSKLKSRRNGWPLNFIITPDKTILHITTYIPPSFKYGTEGMDTLIPRIAKEYKEKNPKLLKQIASYKQILKQETLKASKPKPNKNSIETQFINAMQKRYDKLYKGFDKRPKFPLASHLNSLHNIAMLYKNTPALTMQYDALKAMAYGGIFDQIEGGFYRYSVYPDWVIPHFEKMLYTQAELLPLYYKAYLQTKDEIFKRIIEKTIQNLNENFLSPTHLFYAASDADSLNTQGEKEEGFYFTYAYEEAIEAFKKADIQNHDAITEYLGIEDFGNFEGKYNNVYVVDYEEPKPENLKKALEILRELRKSKAKPFVDKKIITSWNAMMITALFKLSSLNPNYEKQAIQSLDALLEKLYVNQQLYHQSFNENKPSLKAFLEDYAYLTQTLLQAYQTTFKKRYLSLAQTFHNHIIKHYYQNNTWYLDEQKEYAVNFKDKYYTAPISIFFHNGLDIASLTSNLSLKEQMKTYILEQKNPILYELDKHPKAVDALIRLNHEDVILKSSAQNLKKHAKKIDTIQYPYLLKTVQNTQQFLACTTNSCFAFDKDIKTIIQAIDK